MWRSGSEIAIGMGMGETGGIGRAMRRWMTHLLLTAFFFRALLPAGFMPDFSASPETGLKIVICTAVGAKLLVLDASGKPQPAPGNSHLDQPCAFSGLASLALPTLLPLVSGAIEVGAVSFTPQALADLPPARAGPALGSRGPPLVS